MVSRGVLFVTLTYPSAYPGTWAIWKRHLDSWLKRLRRRLPDSGAVWKLEPQKRGAPHFHLLLVGTPFLARDWLSRSWYEVVKSRDVRHLAAGTQVQIAHSHRGVVAYAAKYVAKHEKLPVEWQDGVGRWWGVAHREALNIRWQIWSVTQPAFYTLVRVVRQLVFRRTETATRAPPGWGSAGGWAVLAAADAERLAAWLRTSGYGTARYGTIVAHGAA